mmetsp:Transcript_62124/g.189698  ORF Transcript_62124/g.189698 Transcript_62124/m.189698 type:complete len:227 (-) Transcript_62124:710-1390(-)
MNSLEIIGDVASSSLSSKIGCTGARTSEISRGAVRAACRCRRGLSSAAPSMLMLSSKTFDSMAILVLICFSGRVWKGSSICLPVSWMPRSAMATNCSPNTVQSPSLASRAKGSTLSQPNKNCEVYFATPSTDGFPARVSHAPKSLIRRVVLASMRIRSSSPRPRVRVFSRRMCSTNWGADQPSGRLITSWISSSLRLMPSGSSSPSAPPQTERSSFSKSCAVGSRK